MDEDSIWCIRGCGEGGMHCREGYLLSMSMSIGEEIR